MIRLVVALAIVLSTGLSGGVGRAEAEVRPMTNLELLERTARTAVDSLVRKMPLGGITSLRLSYATNDPANWFVGDILSDRLIARGVKVFVPVGPTKGMGADTTVATSKQGPATPRDSAMVDVSWTPEEARLARILECRVLECAVTYPRSYRSGLLGGTRIERGAEVGIQVRLLANPDGEIYWLERAWARRRDTVARGDLKYVEGTSYPLTKPVYQGKGLGRFVEPLLVGAIVAGLVSLFYTNQR